MFTSQKNLVFYAIKQNDIDIFEHRFRLLCGILNRLIDLNSFWSVNLYRNVHSASKGGLFSS